MNGIKSPFAGRYVAQRRDHGLLRWRVVYRGVLGDTVVCYYLTQGAAKRHVRRGNERINPGSTNEWSDHDERETR